jgi:hypothetical protein
MDMYSRNQYLQEVQKEYWAASKSKKTELLNEAEKRTKLDRKYLIRKLKAQNFWSRKPRKKRKLLYDGQVVAALVRIWEIFDYPCGQRLAPLLKTEVDRLKALGELSCSEEVAGKLKKISPPNIDIKLGHEKQVRHLRKNRHPKTQPLLYQKIPVKLNEEWNKEEVGNAQLDFVAHCGSSALGDFINSLSLADIASGWWEGEAQMGRSQRFTHQSLEEIRKRVPFRLKEMHPDNDSGIINDLIYRYCQDKGIAFSRSRPNKKNDNAYVEQKNWTHVRKIFGYLRYDTETELEIINDLYHHELRLYKNFFQPVIKLISKERVGGKIKRKYDLPKTPYQRLMESDQINEETKEQLRSLYLSLNPAELKRRIDAKLKQLYLLYQSKNQTQEVESLRKLTPRLVTNYIIQSEPVRLPN